MAFDLVQYFSEQIKIQNHCFWSILIKERLILLDEEYACSWTVGQSLEKIIQNFIIWK